MINQTLPTSISIHKTAPFGARLKSAREALGMDQKEVAAQLRLHEQVIVMIENGEFKTDLPLTFIRGYIRNYSKLMDIPENELNEALELLKPKPVIAENELTPLPAHVHVTASGPASTVKRNMPVSIGNFFMQIFTYLIAITLIGLVGIWWHTHKSTTRTSDISPVTQIQAAPNTASPDTSAHQSEANPVTADSKHLSLPMNANAPSLPNAENPDSLTPANANNDAAAGDVIINTAQAPVDTKTALTPAIATPAITAPNIFNRADKVSFTQLVSVDHYTRWLTSFILFLIIITASMRLYATYPAPAMAGARLNKVPDKFGSSYTLGNTSKITNILKKNRFVQLLVPLLIMIALLGYGSTWWYQKPVTHPIVRTVNQPNTVVQKQNPTEMNLPSNVNLDALKPFPDLNSVLMTSFKAYGLQALINQLNDYAAQTAVINFALTDPSTPMGEFTYKKKIRRHRATRNHHYRKSNTNDDANSDNNSGGNIPPYYYNQASGVADQ